MATKPVVVGVDGSEESLRAVEWAAMEAKRHSLPLRIVSAPAMVPRMHAYHASPAAVASALRAPRRRNPCTLVLDRGAARVGPHDHSMPSLRASPRTCWYWAKSASCAGAPIYSVYRTASATS